MAKRTQATGEQHELSPIRGIALSWWPTWL